MPHNISQQLSWAVRSHFKEHYNKHSMQAQGIENRSAKSYSSLKDQLALSKQFGNFLRTDHPEIRTLTQIQPAHFNEFQSKMASADKWRGATATTRASQLRSIAWDINRTVGRDIDITRIKKAEVSPDKVPKERIQVMSDKDFNRIRMTCTDKSTRGKAMDISRASGIRAADLARLRAENIHIKGDRCLIDVKRSKNGKNYTAEVLDKTAIPRIREIKQMIGKGYIFPSKDGKPIKPDSIDKALRRGMQAAGIADRYEKTGFHSIRKAWAQSSYDSCRNNGMSKEQSRAFVAENLGHNDTRGDDNKLISRYIENQW